MDSYQFCVLRLTDIRKDFTVSRNVMGGIDPSAGRAANSDLVRGSFNAFRSEGGL